MTNKAENSKQAETQALNIPVVMPSSCIFCGLKRKIIKETEHFYFFEPIEGISYDYAAKQLCSWIQYNWA